MQSWTSFDYLRGDWLHVLHNECIKTLTLFSDVLCLQEHFLLDAGNKKYNNTYKLKTYFGDSYDMFIKPAFKNDFIISKGRGSGGLAIMWKKTLTEYVTNIKSDLYSVQAVKFNFPSADLLMLIYNWWLTLKLTSLMK